MHVTKRLAFSPLELTFAEPTAADFDSQVLTVQAHNTSFISNTNQQVTFYNMLKHDVNACLTCKAGSWVQATVVPMCLALMLTENANIKDTFSKRNSEGSAKRQVIEENNQNLFYNVVPVALLSYVVR